MSNMTGNVVKYGLIAAVVGGIFYFSDSGTQSNKEEIDLNAALDITVDTLFDYDEGLQGQANQDDDAVFDGFAKTLQSNYNLAQPALYSGTIGVIPQADASLLAYEDANASQLYEEGEEKLFLIEIDGENSRIIASSRDGAVNDHHFSGTGLLAGYLIGSMLSRQRMAGVNPSRLANKKPVSATSAAKARAGSGSHSKGK